MSKPKGRKDLATYRDSMSNPLPEGEDSIAANEYRGDNISQAGSPPALSNINKPYHPATEGRLKTLGSEVMSTKSDMVNSTKKKDYLKELRLKREEKEMKSLQNSSGAIGPTSRNELALNRLTTNNRLSEIQKHDAIKMHARQIEERAKMKELQLRMRNMKRKDSLDPVGNDMAAVEQTMEVNDMYIDAIQAKLKILDQI